MKSKISIGILISAGTEWRATLPLFPNVELMQSPFGQYFYPDNTLHPTVFLHGGWGKVATSGSTQYVIDQWKPKLLVNIGTCGGIEGCVELNSLILAEETIIYDIIEGMSSYQQGIEYYSTKANLNWIEEKLPPSIKKIKMLSANRDIRPEDVRTVFARLNAFVGDWESGAFAWVCAKNKIDWLVVRGVSDLINKTTGEALGNVSVWRKRVFTIMPTIVGILPLITNQYFLSQ